MAKELWCLVTPVELGSQPIIVLRPGVVVFTSRASRAKMERRTRSSMSLVDPTVRGEVRSPTALEMSSDKVGRGPWCGIR